MFLLYASLVPLSIPHLCPLHPDHSLSLGPIITISSLPPPTLAISPLYSLGLFRHYAPTLPMSFLCLPLPLTIPSVTPLPMSIPHLCHLPPKQDPSFSPPLP